MEKVKDSLGGFTLPELIITTAILAIILGIATPSWQRWTENSAQRTLINEYHTLFSFARWSAASHRRLVTVCPLSTQNRCVDDWQRPISVFFDSNNDKQPDDNRILRKVALKSALFNTTSRTGGKGYFQFNPNGMIHGATGSLILCPSRTEGTRMSYMAINKGGRFRVEHDNDEDRIIKLPWGPMITCSP
ncbi:GspH/FimT family pseudopilin [Marinobacter sediminum]|uniref:GspH/FimT family pseudopilin n=1 Tax=Marinobacter sediminum TaxID=256323 RepID=UPI001939F05E|nr:GspH/FimT family pseudopilin [Marinobacter sediminum]